MKKITLFIGVTLFVISCSPKTTEAVVETVTEVEAEDAMPTMEIAEGKGLYEAKCHRCHKLKTVTDYTESQWANILPDMAKKAKLDDSQTGKINQYITWKIQK